MATLDPTRSGHLDLLDVDLDAAALGAVLDLDVHGAVDTVGGELAQLSKFRY